MLFKVEGKLIFLPLQDNVACIEEFYLSSAFEASSTDLGDLGKTLNDLSIIATVEDVIYELEHIDAVPLQEVVNIGAQ